MIAFLRRLLHRVERPRQIEARPSLQLTGGGVAVWHGGNVVASFRWQDVTGIAAFKRDFLTWDDVRLAFRFPDGWVELSEEWEGWSDVVMEMARRFPSI